MPVTIKKGDKEIEYNPVAERLKSFYEDHADGFIKTEIISHSDGEVVIKAMVGWGGALIGFGHAMEKEGSNYINKTSYLENCETSAVGRALAFAGYSGGEIASADEVVSALRETMKPRTMSKAEVKAITKECKDRAIPVEELNKWLITDHSMALDKCPDFFKQTIWKWIKSYHAISGAANEKETQKNT
jgi:hypothetical protein